MKGLHVCIGSLNPTKINAVKLALGYYYDNFKVHSIRVKSGVPDQPIGQDAIIQGAKNRAKEALMYLIERKYITDNIFGIGIEAGLVPVTLANTGYLDFQYCVIIDHEEDFTMGAGIAFEYPQSVIDEVISPEKKEVGNVVGKLASNMNLKNESGAISFLSNGIINRTEILTQAVICALLPRINKRLYK